jgi:hypothetical protein
MLSIGKDWDRAIIGGHELLFSDVARTLRKLHEIGQQLFIDRESETAARGTVTCAIGTTVLLSRPWALPLVGDTDA